MALDFGDEIGGDVVVVAFMRTFAAVFLRQLDTLPLYFIDRSHMNPVCPDNFHMLFNFAEIGHVSLLNSQYRRLSGPSVQQQHPEKDAAQRQSEQA
jgi:hypothetical protein